MNCPSPTTIEAFFRGDLPADDLARVEEHVSGCPDCAAREPSVTQTRLMLDDLRVVIDRGHADPSADLLAGRLPGGAKFGPYEIRSLLGVGGMARVYLAVHSETSREVALKILKAEHQASAEIQRRFGREARAMSQVRHPNILAIYDCPMEGESIGIAMELVRGGSLRDWIADRSAKHRLPEADAVFRYASQAAKGLGAAHAQGFVHRDIKPSNLLLTGDGQLKVADFGVVQALDSTTWVTGTGHHIGTPAYMSPEQCRGGRLTSASDVYSLGVTMYELATGKLPFDVEGGSPFALMLKHVSVPPADPRSLNPEIPDRLAVIILRCLEKGATDRYGDADALAAALDRAAAPEADPYPTPQEAGGAKPLNREMIRRQLELLPQRSIVAWSCRCARRVQQLNRDPRVDQAIALAESVASTTQAQTDQPTSTRMLATMKKLRAASLAAAYGTAEQTQITPEIAAARAAAATSAAAAARCTTDAAADAVFALENALIACQKGNLPVPKFWKESQQDYRRLHTAALGAPGTIGQPVPGDFWKQ